MRTTVEPWACLASDQSQMKWFTPESVTLVSCFIDPFRQGRIHDRSTPPQQARAVRVKPQLRMRTGTGQFCTLQAAGPCPRCDKLEVGWSSPFETAPAENTGARRIRLRGRLLADTHLQNYSLVPLGIVLLQIVEQAATPTHHHQKTATRCVVLLVRYGSARSTGDALARRAIWTSGLRYRRCGLVLLDDIGFLLSC